MGSGIGRIFSCVVLLLVFFLGMGWLFPLLFPFLLGLGLALAAEPLVRFLHDRLRLPRALGAGIGVIAAFLALTLLVLILAAFLLRELKLLAGILPDLEAAALSGLTLLEDWLLTLSSHAPMSLQPLLYQNVTEFFSGGTALLGQVGKYILSLAGGILSHIPDSFLTLGTALISGCMLSARLPRLRHWARERLGSFRSLMKTLHRLRSAVGQWILAQCKLAGVTLGILTLGLVLLRVPYAPLWAFGITFLDALPILGTGTVLLPWSLIAFLGRDGGRAVGLLAVYAVVTLTRSTLEPRFLGQQLGLDPLVTLAALYTGYRLWGLAGMILAPLLAVTLSQLLPHKGEGD